MTPKCVPRFSIIGQAFNPHRHIKFVVALQSHDQRLETPIQQTRIQMVRGIVTAQFRIQFNLRQDFTRSPLQPLNGPEIGAVPQTSLSQTLI